MEIDRCFFRHENHGLWDHMLVMTCMVPSCTYHHQNNSECFRKVIAVACWDSWRYFTSHLKSSSMRAFKWKAKRLQDIASSSNWKHCENRYHLAVLQRCSFIACEGLNSLWSFRMAPSSCEVVVTWSACLGASEFMAAPQVDGAFYSSIHKVQENCLWKEARKVPTHKQGNDKMKGDVERIGEGLGSGT